MPTGTRGKSNLSWLLGTTMSVVIATALIFLVRGTQRSILVPIVFIVVIVLCARYFGVIAGILGSVVATGMFALFLFQPYGSFRVADHQALSNLGLLLFAGIALSYANAEDDDTIPGPLKPR
jgi:K+-sensing histidine kinase KdpD